MYYESIEIVWLMKQLKVEWVVNMLLILLIKSQGKKGEMMKKIKVMVVFGTRPEAIKMAPLVLELQKQSETIETITVVTAQHRQMLDQVLETFRIQPDYDLDIMGKNQSLLDITARILEKFDPVVKEVQPDMILVHGDTTTTFAASLVAFYN